MPPNRRRPTSFLPATTLSFFPLSASRFAVLRCCFSSRQAERCPDGTIERHRSKRIAATTKTNRTRKYESTIEESKPAIFSINPLPRSPRPSLPLVLPFFAGLRTSLYASSETSSSSAAVDSAQRAALAVEYILKEREREFFSFRKRPRINTGHFFLFLLFYKNLQIKTSPALAPLRRPSPAQANKQTRAHRERECPNP